MIVLISMLVPKPTAKVSRYLPQHNDDDKLSMALLVLQQESTRVNKSKERTMSVNGANK